jgi:hypothetical protein
MHGDLDGEASPGEACRVDEIVREREHVEQLGDRVVPSQPRRQRAPVVGRRRCQLPGHAAADHAVDREAAAVDLDQLRVVRNADRAPADPVLERGEPVRPRVQQRDAHRVAVVLVLGKPALLGEQLVAAVAQRAADHAGARDEGRLELSLVVAQPYGLERCCLPHRASAS